MNLPGPGKGKSKSNMPCKPGKQCATSGTGSKVQGASKVSMKDKQKERLKKIADVEEEDDLRKKNPKLRAKDPSSYGRNSYRSGGMIGKTHNRNDRTAGDSGYCNR